MFLTSRQRRLLEARDPDFEKQIEPKLRSPISIYSGYTSPQKKIQRKMRDIGLPVRQANWSSDKLNVSATQENPYPAGSRPKDYVVPSIGQGDFNRAMHYWLKNFNGERWPALEQAFLNRSNTYKGKGGDFVRPRLSVFKYLGKLREPWPEGEKLVGSIVPFSNLLWGVDNNSTSSHVLNYLIHNGIENKSVTQTVKKILAAEKSATSDEVDDIALPKTPKTFADYGALGSQLRKYAERFNLDGGDWKDPEVAYKEQARLERMCQSCKKRPFMSGDHLCGTCSRLWIYRDGIGEVVARHGTF